VSADGTTYALPDPFFVVATQNPHEQLGTYALPESQLDRFLMRVTLGYPDAAHERALLRGGERRELLASIPPALSAAAVQRVQRAVREVHIADALLDYTQTLIAQTREREDLKLGLSRARRACCAPRGLGALGPRGGAARGCRRCCPRWWRRTASSGATRRHRQPTSRARCRRAHTALTP
jgi:hypothetical protein